MKTMKKILAFALAGVMALALLTGCGTRSSASHKSIAKAMEDYDQASLSKIRTYFSTNLALSNKVVCLYCGKYDKDAGKQAINLNAHYAYINTSNIDLAGERQIGLITTSFTDTNGKKVKVRFAVVVSEIPTP